VAQGIGPEFKPQYYKRKKKEQVTNKWGWFENVLYISMGATIYIY
jgi:hypothetical protein